MDHWRSDILRPVNSTRTFQTGAMLLQKLDQRVAVRDIAAALEPRDFTESAQTEIIDHLGSIVEYNPYYVNRFLKEYIGRGEDHGLLDEVYDLLGETLGSVELGATDSDVITYSVGAGGVIIKETPRLILGHNTTGFRTWEAAMFLANQLEAGWFKNKSVLELGGGTGLLSLALAKYHQPKLVTMTDGSAELIDKFGETLLLNQLTQQDIRCQQLLWGTTNVCLEDFVQEPPDGIDVLVAADVTYDSSVLELLACTMQDFFDRGTELALIAATIRNEATISDWEDDCLGNRFDWSVLVHIPKAEVKNCWFMGEPVVKIYKIRPLKDQNGAH